MKSSTVGLILGIVGVAVILAPVALFMVTGYGSPIQRLLDSELAPGLPMGILLSACGAAISAVGVIVFIRGIRAIGASPPLAIYNRPARARPQPTRGSELDEIEVEIERLLRDEMPGSEPRVEVRTPQPPQQEVSPPVKTSTRPAAATQQIPKPPAPDDKKPMVEVISRGLDMVCRTCGAVNPLGQSSCVSCGGRIFEPNPKLPACPVCGAPLEGEYKVDDKMICTICFSELRIRKR